MSGNPPDLPQRPIVSPDGRHEWDGQQWKPRQLVISPDGRQVWDGQNWQPREPAAVVSPEASMQVNAAGELEPTDPEWVVGKSPTAPRRTGSGQTVQGANDEPVVAEDAFMFSLSHFFLKTDVSLTTKRVSFDRPNVLLGVIPVGRSQTTYPLRNVSGVSTSTRVAVLRLLIGVVLILVGANNSGAIFWLVIGAFLALSAFQAAIVVGASGGERTPIYIAITDRGRAQEFANQVNARVANI